MTIPTLIQGYGRVLAKARLKKYYSMMNNAIKLAEIDYGDTSGWLDSYYGCDYIVPAYVETDKDENPVSGKSPNQKFFNKYFAPYLPISHTEYLPNGSYIVYFRDGTAMRPGISYVTSKCYHWIFYPGNAKRCGFEDNSFEYPKYNGGKCRFAFEFRPGIKSNERKPYGFQGFGFTQETTRTNLRNDCINYGFWCTGLIQYDGWDISIDYPRKIKL